MSTVNQIYSILNSLNAQANGGSAIAATDTRSFISYGDAITSLTDANKETWFTTLIDRIATTIIDNRKYTAQGALGLWREPFEYGAIMQKIFSKMPAASADSAWSDPSDLSSTNPFAPTVREIEQRMYNKISAFMFSDTIPDVQLKTAFLDEQKMAAFLDSLMMTTQNAFERSVENLGRTCRSSLIATAVHANDAHYVKLLTNYKAMLDDDDPEKTITAEQALHSRNFLRYASREIAVYIDRMQTLTDIYSADGYERFSPREYLNVAILNDFDKSVNSYLLAEAYNESLLSLPTENRVVVPYWQGAGSDFSYANNSKIHLTIPRTTGTDEQIAAGYTIEASNIIGVIYDSEAAGITIDERRTRSLYNPKDEFTNYWHKGREMYYVDVTHPHVVFALN
jgi:hypothetical protein